jgi:putative addiction module component (TIGR02574 family)
MCRSQGKLPYSLLAGAGSFVGLPILIFSYHHYFAGGRAMPVSIEALGIDQYSVQDRLDLIEQIWDSLPDKVGPDEVPAWHLAELTKRRAEAERTPGVGKPWRDALARFGNGT